MMLQKLLIIILMLSCTACGEDAAVVDPPTRDLIDSLTAKEIKELEVQYNRECSDSFELRLARSVDSIKQVREREIQQTLAR